METVSKFPGCQESKQARKIFLNKTNELREIALMGEKGKWIEAGPSNNPDLRSKVDEIFAHSQLTGNPCPLDKGKGASSARGSEQ